MRYVGYATSADNIRISPEVFNFTTDERKQFVKGFADVTGYIVEVIMHSKSLIIEYILKFLIIGSW